MRKLNRPSQGAPPRQLGASYTRRAGVLPVSRAGVLPVSIFNFGRQLPIVSLPAAIILATSLLFFDILSNTGFAFGVLYAFVVVASSNPDRRTNPVLARIHRRTPMDGVRKAEGG